MYAVYAPDGEAKFWMEPQVELATSTGMRQAQLREVHRLVKEHADDIRDAWKVHFGD